jgi:hypothetical protein
LDFRKTATISPETAAAADGIVVVGAGDSIKHSDKPNSSRGHHAEILDLSNPAKPFFRKSLSLPGKLLAVSELDRRGFLAWTEEALEQDYRRNLVVGATNLRDYFEVSRIEDIDYGPMVVGGKNVFLAKSTNLQGYRLDEAAVFLSLGSASLDWSPRNLRLLDGDLCAFIDRRFAAVPVSSFPAGWRSWNTGLGYGYFWNYGNFAELENLLRLPDGDYAVPQGDYGVEVFK